MIYNMDWYELTWTAMAHMTSDVRFLRCHAHAMLMLAPVPYLCYVMISSRDSSHPHEHQWKPVHYATIMAWNISSPYGGFHKWGIPKMDELKWTILQKWMMTGDTPIHVETNRCFNMLKPKHCRVKHPTDFVEGEAIAWRQCCWKTLLRAVQCNM